MHSSQSSEYRVDKADLLLVLIMGVGFAVIWSSAFSVAKILVTYTPPFTISSIRFIIAALLAGSLALALGQSWPRGATAWRAIVILGLCQNTLYLGLFFTAMTRIPAGLAAIIASAMPLLVAALAPVLISERIGWVRASGLMIGFAGVLWIMGTRITGGIDLFGIFLACGGVVALSVATLTIKRVDFGTGMLMVVACQMLIGGLGCIPIAFLLEDVTEITVNRAVIFAFAYQVVMPGIAATLIWFSLVKRITAAGASSFHFLNPIFGVAFAYFLLAEPISALDMIGVALVAAGILIVNMRRASRDRE